MLESINSVDGQQVYDLESEELLRELYRRAESSANGKGQGDRVLAYLYQNMEEKYLSLKDDPSFDPLRETIRTAKPGELDPRSFRFAPSVVAASEPLSPAMERAVRELGYVYADGNLSELSRLCSRAFRKPEFKFGAYLAQADSAEGALKLAFQSHQPPPPAMEVVTDLMDATLEKSLALKDDKQFLESLREVKSATNLDRMPEGVLRTISRNGDRLPSRARQIAEAAEQGLAGRIPKTAADSMANLAELLAHTGMPNMPDGHFSFRSAAQNYSNYLSTSFEGAADTAHGSGISPGAARAARSYSTTPPPAAYRAAAKEALAGANKLPRTFSRAIRSARAARGIAAGATLEFGNAGTPVHAAWVANSEDDRFGKLIVKVNAGDGQKPFLAASQTMFADSFLAAADVIWGEHSGTAAFKEGEILVVMSMDPFDTVDPKASKAIQLQIDALRKSAVDLAEDDLAGQLKLMKDIQDIQLESGSIPRRIVFHPALFGREMAWSVARVDFWFNDIPGLDEEAQLVNGGKPMPAAFNEIDITQASTWQFFERPGSILAKTSNQPIGTLAVRSGDSNSNSMRGHFGVSMFAFDESSEETGEGRPLKQLESELQPMLDWLSENHPDFIRLGDFAESLAYSRWLKHHGIAPLIFDLDGEPAPIATPNCVIIGEGPKLRKPKGD